MQDCPEAPNRRSTTPEPVYLVLERDIIVADDIAASLRVMGPCRIIHVTDPAEIAGHLDSVSRIHAAFLEMSFAEVVDSGLDLRLSRNDTGIVLTVGEDDAESARGRGWGMLVRPFTDRMIRDSIRSLRQKA